ncbi:MAG: M56 family metallopeptidase [Aureispira sp.]
MLPYWFLSCLLFSLGALLYHFLLRHSLKVQHAKYVLVGMVLLSWGIPMLVPSLPAKAIALEKDYLKDYRNYTAWNVVDIQDGELLHCYAGANNSQEQCHCEVKQQAEVLAYQSNPYYNCLLICKQPIYWLFLAVMGMLLLQLFFRWSGLVYLVYNNQLAQEKHQLSGTTFYLLRPHQKLPFPISSFTLWRNYILLDQQWEAQFSKEELEAIFLHEVAHLQQRDTWQQLLLQGLQALWWMHPLYYYLQRELNRLNEYVADDFAAQQLGDVKRYARTLLKAKEQQLQQQQRLNLVLYFAQGLFKQRIVRLIAQPQQRYQPHWLLTLSVLGILFWQSSAVALPALQAQDEALRSYELWQVEQQKLPQEEVCPTCGNHKISLY